MVLTSVLAGLATAPFAAATFNRFTDYGLLANLLTVPMMSILMAAGAMAALLAPFGLAAPAYWAMEAASRWILFVAHWVAGLDGAVTPVIAPGPLVIPLITLAGAWAILWRGPWRLAAAGPMAVAFGLWVMRRPPHGADLQRRRLGRGDDGAGPRPVDPARRGVFGGVVVAG